MIFWPSLPEGDDTDGPGSRRVTGFVVVLQLLPSSGKASEVSTFLDFGHKSFCKCHASGNSG